MAKEGETPDEGGASSLEDLRRTIREQREQIRDLNAEARDFRLERNDARKRVKELQDENAELAKGKGGDPKAAGRIKALEAENRGLKHRAVFNEVAKDAGAKSSPKALEALWKAIDYDAEGEAVAADILAKIEAAKADHDFLFNAPGDDGARPTPEGKAKGGAAGDGKPATPAKPPGPGASGRGAPPESAGRIKIRRSDLQSFDPKVNPLMDDSRSGGFIKARQEGRVDFVDE